MSSFCRTLSTLFLSYLTHLSHTLGSWTSNSFHVPPRKTRLFPGWKHAVGPVTLFSPLSCLFPSGVPSLSFFPYYTIPCPLLSMLAWFCTALSSFLGFSFVRPVAFCKFLLNSPIRLFPPIGLRFSSYPVNSSLSLPLCSLRVTP